MRVAVVGAGGVGGYFGGKLAAAGVDTTFIVRGRTLDALRTRGLRIESTGGDFALDRVTATDDPAAIGTVDVILMAVKAWQVADAVRTLRPMIGDDTDDRAVGERHRCTAILSDVVGREHVAGGLCAIVSFIVEPGHIRHAAFEPMVMFGELDNHRSEIVRRVEGART